MSAPVANAVPAALQNLAAVENKVNVLIYGDLAEE